MSLVWHIAKKDVRRLTLPTLVWLAFIVLPMVAFRFASPTVEGHAGSSIGGSVALMSIWVRLLTGVQLLIAYVLAAALVVEDPLVGDNGFWMTRPISNARLFGAKLVGAVVLFVVLPFVALVPIWFGSGFSLNEVCAAGWELTRAHGMVALIALTIGSFSCNLAQVLFFTIAIGGAYVGSLVLSTPLVREMPVPVRLSRYSLTIAIPLVASGFVLAQQYLTRRLFRTWSTVVVVVFICLAVQVAWPWDFHSGIEAWRKAARFEETAEDRAAEIVAGPTLTKFNRSSNEYPNLFVTAPWNRSGFYIPMFATFADGSIARGSAGAGSVEAGLRVLGLRNDESPMRWQVMLAPHREPAGQTPHLAGRIEIWAVRPRIMAEIPLRLGARGASGADQTRIIELGRRDERLDEIFLEERDARSTSSAGWNRSRSQTDFGELRYIDWYYLVNRAAGKAQLAPASELGSVDINSLVLNYRRLHVSGTDDWREGVLIKLRFECDHRFERPFEVNGITTLRP